MVGYDHLMVAFPNYALTIIDLMISFPYHHRFTVPLNGQHTILAGK